MNYFISQFGRPSGAMGRFLGKVMTVSNKKMHRTVLSDLGQFSRLLEIGSGSGAQLEMISKKFPECELYGIDISEDMVKMAQERLGDTAKLSLCDCADMPFEDGYFDTVITTDTCYFWSDPGKVLREISRVTAPKSRLIIACNAMYAASVHKMAGGSMYDSTSIIAEIKSAGMRLVSQKNCGFMQTVYEIET